jgi:hypothetical protein
MQCNPYNVSLGHGILNWIEAMTEGIYQELINAIDRLSLYELHDSL